MDLKKKITLIWEAQDDLPNTVPATLTFEEKFYITEGQTVPNGEWIYPYPNTEEDSWVFGLMEVYAQGSSPVAVFVQSQGLPDKTIISDA